MYDIEKIWPKWKVQKTIGEGSFGKVFEISRSEYGIEEHSALKVISIPQSDKEVQSLRNDGMTEDDTTEYFKGVVGDFAKEIRLMSRLKGVANIVAYEDFEVIEKKDSIGFDILIRMELLTGLPDYLRENKFRVSDVIQLGIDMCRALETCRELNIVHRDIKPDNIFVAPNGSYKLGDFGVARTIEKTMAGLSRKGTLSYMAPEIYMGNEYGFEADIYSLGLVLYKLLNDNRDPFLPPHPTPVKYSERTEAITKRIQGYPLPKPIHADGRLADIIVKACAHNPAYRYADPREFRKDLEAIVPVYAELQNTVLFEKDNSETIVMSTCPVCKKELKPGVRFCGYCGHKVGDEVTVSKSFNQDPMDSHIEKIYEKMNAETRDSIFYGGVSSAKSILRTITETVCGSVNERNVDMCHAIYLQVWIRSRGGMQLEFMTPTYIRQALVKRFSEIFPDTVISCVNASLNFIYSKEPNLREKAMQIEATLKFIRENAAKNKAIENRHLNDADYGLCPEKPVFVDGFDGAKVFLDRLRTVTGKPITYKRVGGGMEINGIAGPVDAYAIHTYPENLPNCIYICNYGTRMIDRAPEGFMLVDK